jgi:hypothetical protein
MNRDGPGVAMDRGKYRKTGTSMEVGAELVPKVRNSLPRSLVYLAIHSRRPLGNRPVFLS